MNEISLQSSFTISYRSAYTKKKDLNKIRTENEESQQGSSSQLNSNRKIDRILTRNKVSGTLEKNIFYDKLNYLKGKSNRTKIIEIRKLQKLEQLVELNKDTGINKRWINF